MPERKNEGDSSGPSFRILFNFQNCLELYPAFAVVQQLLLLQSDSDSNSSKQFLYLPSSTLHTGPFPYIQSCQIHPSILHPSSYRFPGFIFSISWKLPTSPQLSQQCCNSSLSFSVYKAVTYIVNTAPHTDPCSQSLQDTYIHILYVQSYHIIQLRTVIHQTCCLPTYSIFR